MEEHSNKLCADSKIPNICTARAILVSVWEVEHHIHSTVQAKEGKGAREKRSNFTEKVLELSNIKNYDSIKFSMTCVGGNWSYPPAFHLKSRDR